MSQNQNVAYLDFPDEARSLSFDSFFEDGKQTLERPTIGENMCICAHLDGEGKLAIVWNGAGIAELGLAAGDHKILLDEHVPSGHGELTLSVVMGDESVSSRSYRLVGDYVMEYSEYQFRVYKDYRQEQTLARLRMQCPAPQNGQTFASLSAEKYQAASSEIEKMARLLGDVHAIDLSHMFNSVQVLGDSDERRKFIDAALGRVSDQLHMALWRLEEPALNVEHARYYADQIA